MLAGNIVRALGLAAVCAGLVQLTGCSTRPPAHTGTEPSPGPALGTQEAALAARGLVTPSQVQVGLRQAQQTRDRLARPDPAADNPRLKAQWGVEVLSVSYAADGFWLLFRFQVHDPAKARDLFDTQVRPHLIAEASGVKLAVPTAAKIGALRTTDRGNTIQAGRIYTIMFSNPGFLVQPGQKVTVASGGFRVEHLTVRGKHDNLHVGEVRAQADTRAAAGGAFPAQ
jgi:hypothetical protein